MKLNKFVRILLLSMAAIFVFILGAFADEPYYELMESGDFWIYYPEVYEENGVEDRYEDLIVGYNYKIRYRLPVPVLYFVDAEGDEEIVEPTAYTISWDIKPLFSNNDWLNIEQITSDDSSDIMVLSGILPVQSGDYNFVILATVVDVADKDYDGEAIGCKTSFDEELTIALIDDERILAVSGDTSFDTSVTCNESTDLTIVTPEYSVDVRAIYIGSGRSKRISDYIASPDEYDDFELIDLPEWLKYDVIDTYLDEEYDEEYITGVNIKFNNDYTGLLENGTNAVVRVPFIDSENEDPSFVVGWDVKFVSEDKIESIDVSSIDIDPKSLSFSFISPDEVSEKTQTVKFFNRAPVSFDISNDIPANVAVLSVDIPSDTSVKSGSISVKVTPVMPLVSGDYSAVILFVDSADNKVSLDVKVNISITPQEILNRSFDIYYDGRARYNPISVTVKASGDVEHVELIASGDIEGRTIRWTVSNDVKGLTVLPTSTNLDYNVSADFTIKADATVSPDIYTVRINASILSDDTITSPYVDLNITVNSMDLPTPPKDESSKSFDIFYEGRVRHDPISVTVKASGDVEHVELITSGDIEGETIKWTVSNDVKGLTITPASTNLAYNASADFTIKADATASPDVYTVRINASLASDSSITPQYVDLHITIQSMDLSDDKPADLSDPSQDRTPDEENNIPQDPSQDTQPQTPYDPGIDPFNPYIPDQNEDSSGGNTTYDNNNYTAVQAQIVSSDFKFTKMEAVHNLLSLFDNISTDISNLEGNNLLPATPRTSVDPKEIPVTERAVLIFPLCRVARSKIYVFAIDLLQLEEGGLSEGEPMYIKMARQTDDSSFYTSALNSENAAIVDNDGNIVRQMPPLSWDKGLNVAAYMFANTTYSPVITTSSADKLGAADVGCNGGFSVLALVLAVSTFIIGKQWYN